MNEKEDKAKTKNSMYAPYNTFLPTKRVKSQLIIQGWLV